MQECQKVPSGLQAYGGRSEPSAQAGCPNSSKGACQQPAWRLPGLGKLCSKFAVTCDIPNKVLAKASGVCERTLQRYFQKDVPRQCVVAASNWRAESKAQREQLASQDHFHPKPGEMSISALGSQLKLSPSVIHVSQTRTHTRALHRLAYRYVNSLYAFDPAEFAALHAEDKRVWQVTRERYQRMKEATKDKIEERIASMLAKG